MKYYSKITSIDDVSSYAYGSATTESGVIAVVYTANIPVTVEFTITRYKEYTLTNGLNFVVSLGTINSDAVVYPNVGYYEGGKYGNFIYADDVEFAPNVRDQDYLTSDKITVHFDVNTYNVTPPSNVYDNITLMTPASVYSSSSPKLERTFTVNFENRGTQYNKQLYYNAAIE